jgi:Uma2 family endonuclease
MVETMPVAEPEPVTDSAPPAAFDMEEVVEGRVIRMLDHPITFDEWLEICGPKDFHELEDGVLVAQPTIQWEHEKADSWLLVVLKTYTRRRDLGVVLHSRCAVRIDPFRGRLSDIFFVRKDRVSVVGDKSTEGAPDFVVEIVSPNDRPSHLYALQTDYQNLGIPEIWFVDLPRQRLRMLRKQGNQYVETTATEGPIQVATVEGLVLQAEWLLSEPRPDEIDTVLNLLQPGGDRTAG